MVTKEQLLNQVREGMTVFGADDRLIGTVDAVGDRGLRVNGAAIPGGAIDSVVKRHIYLEEPAGAYPAAATAADAGPADAS
jgi:hypothetical protein